MTREDLFKIVNSPLGNASSLKDLIDIAISFEKPVKFTDSIGDEKEVIMEINNEYNNTYFQNSSMIIFQYENVTYLLPRVSKIKQILEAVGFQCKLRRIALNNCTPIEYFEYWNDLCVTADLIQDYEDVKFLEESQKEIQKYSQQKGFKPLSTDLLSRCFKVPIEGVDVIQNGENIKLIPESLLSIERKTIDFEKIGTITPMFGIGEIYTFIYIDGNTYITQSKEVNNQLIQNGFKHSSLIPPLMFTKSTKFEDKKLQEIYDKTIMTDEEYYEKASQEKINIYQRQIEYWKSVAEKLKAENEQLKTTSSNVDSNTENEIQGIGPILS